MYAAAMRLSPRFRRQFAEFWGLADDFAMEEEGRA